MRQDIEKEFLDQFNNSGLEPFKDTWTDHRFQILNREGEVIVSTRNSMKFYPLLNRKHLKRPFPEKEFRRTGGYEALPCFLFPD
jgi:hypothetical protein